MRRWAQTIAQILIMSVSLTVICGGLMVVISVEQDLYLEED